MKNQHKKILFRIARWWFKQTQLVKFWLVDLVLLVVMVFLEILMVLLELIMVLQK